MARQLSSSVSRDPVLPLLKNTCPVVERGVEHHVPSQPSLPGRNSISKSCWPKSQDRGWTLSPSHPAPLHNHYSSAPLPVSTSSLHRPCSRQPQGLNQGISPSLSAQGLLRPRILTVAPRTLCLCSFSIIPDSLITTEPLHVLLLLSISNSSDVHIHGLCPLSGLSRTFPATCKLCFVGFF